MVGFLARLVAKKRFSSPSPGFTASPPVSSCLLDKASKCAFRSVSLVSTGETMFLVALSLLSFSYLSNAYRYDQAYLDYNLNQNKTAIDPLDYWGEWSGHEYNPSPANWRFPFYTLFLDRFVSGSRDP